MTITKREFVPLVDLTWQHRQIAAPVEEQVLEIMRSGAFVGGAGVAQFEQNFSTFCGVEHCVGVANGTDALELAMRAAGVAVGDLVALPANTFIATAEAVVRIGAQPVLVDCDPDYHLMDPGALESVLHNFRPKAIVPVHLYGQLAPMEEIMQLAEDPGCIVIEDAAQSQGAKQLGRSMGQFGHLTATSFYPGKNLGAYGDGGAVLTDDTEFARMVRLLSNHGSEVRYQHEVSGMNSRLDNLQATVLSAKLDKLSEWNDLRRSAAANYNELLADTSEVRGPSQSVINDHVWHLYVIQTSQRDRVLEGLQSRGVGAGIHYPVPVHLQPAFASLGLGVGSFPNAERSANEILSLPIYPGITEDQQDRVVATLEEVLKEVLRSP